MAKFIQKNATWLVPLTVGLGAATVAAWAFSAALDANPIGLIALAIIAVAVGIALLVENWDKITAAIDNSPWWVKVLLGIAGIMNPIIGLIEIIYVLATNWGAIWGWISQAASDAADWITNAFNDVIDFFKGLPGAILGALSSLWNIITQPFVDAWNWCRNIADKIGHVLDNVASMIAGALSDVWHTITQPFRDAWDTVKGIGEDIAGAVKGAKNLYNGFAREWNKVQVDIPGIDIGPIHIGGRTFGLPDLPILAKGGIVMGPTIALIGERGPEAVVPLGRSNQFGATVINLNVTAAGLGADAPEIQHAVVNALRGYVDRNGRLLGVT
jgi:multisubunit Na+/H+ antiporter MnhB subunit